jgi:hypothetical protein
MSASQPPRLASWLLHHLASSPQRESLAGDLIERYHQGQSATWYWRQVLAAILAGVIRDIREGTPMDLHIKKVWLPGAASCLVFFGFYWVLIWLPFDKTRFQFMALPYLVLPFVGALAAYGSRRMKGSVLERIVSALFPVFAFVALFAVRIVYGLFFEGVPYTLPHFLAGFSVTLVFIVVGGLLLVLGAWPFCRPHLREQLP